MAEMPDLKRKYGFQLKPEQMLYMQQMRPRSGGQIATDIISQSSPDLKPAPGNFFQRASEGARIAGDLVNKYAPKVYEKIPQKITSLAPFGFVGLNQGFQDLLSQSRKDVINTEVPTSLKIIPSIDTATGEMQPAGFGEGRTTVGKVVKAIKPADLLGISSAERVYGNLGYGQAPEPLDVLDTLGLHAGMLQAGKAGFKGASTLARAGAPYAAEGLTNLVSKYGVDPRMNILPEGKALSDAVPEGFKLAQEGGKSVVYDASGKIFAKGDDAKAAIFRANKRLENEAANAARAARREERAAEAPVTEQKPLVKVWTDENATLFYNPLKKAAANLGDETDPIKVLNELRSFENVTDDQIKFSGIDQYLESKAALGEGTSLDEVREFIDQNRIKLYESYRDDGGGSSRYSPEDLEIRERAMDAEDPDDSYISDMADNEEEYLRDYQYDEIYEDVRDRYENLNDDEIREKVDEIISDRAYEAARDAYWDNPIYRGENDLGYVITGNRDQGYIVRGPNGQDIRPNRGYFDDVDDANIAIVEHAQENGLIGDPTKRTIYGENSQYSQYMMPGGSNYRELNIGLEAGSKDKSAGKVRLYEEYMNRLEEEAREIRREYPIISERPPEVAARIEEISNRIQVASDLRQNAKSNSSYGADPWYGGHFEDDPDLFAQLRLQDYQDVDGMSGTLIDEAQSDMHQKGRERGYKGSRKEIEEKNMEHGSASSKFQERASTIRAFGAYDGFNPLLDDMTLGDDDLFFKRLARKISKHNEEYPETPISYPETEEEIAKIKEVVAEGRRVRELGDEAEKLSYGIPDAPFKKDWYHVAIRRAIKDAIDNGKDRVYLPTGEALANRYNYANAVDQIAYTERDDGKFNIAFKDFDGRWHNSIGNQSFSNLKPGDLDSILGKEMAKKVREGFKDSENVPDNVKNAGYSNLIENQSIDVGGKGFKKYYDETYPNFMKKEANEFGAKTGYTKIPTPVTSDAHREKLIRSTARANRISADEMRQRIRNWSQGQQDNFFNNRQEPVFYIEINDAMREAYGKGRPYARGGLVTDALDAVEEHFQKGGKVPAKNESEAKNIEPVPLLGRLAGMLGESSEFLKSRPLKEEGSWQAKGAASAVNSVLELVDQFFVNDLAKTADRMAYGFPVTSGKGETLKPLPETTGAVLTVAPPAAKLASKTARVVKNAAPLMEQATKQGAETVFDMLERYAPQPMYVVPPGKRMSRAEAEAAGLWHPISNEKLSRPYGEMTSTTVDNPAVIMPARKVLTPEDLYKKAGFPLIGDRAATGKILTHINDQPLAWPVPLTGGPEYMMANLAKKPGQSAAWESGKGKVTTLQNRIEEAVKQNPDDVVGVYSSGSLQQGDFNTMMSDALAAQLKSSKISKQAAEEFNADVRNFFPEFVGINSKKLRDQLLDLKNGVLRTAFVKRMAQENFQKKGFPDVASTRKAIMEPIILEDPIGTTGFTVASMDKNRRIVTPRNPSGYPLAMGGEYIGGFETRLPHNIMFSSKEKQRRLLGADPAGDYRSYELAQPVQMFDQEWLDTVNKYLEQRKKLTGKKEGGVIDNDDAPPLPRNAGEVEEWRRKLKAYEDRQYWKRRGANSADENDTPIRLEGKESYPMRTKVPEKLNKYFMPEFREEDLPFKKALRYYGKGGNVEGVKITETYSIAPEAKQQKLSKAEEAAFQRDVRRTKWFQQFSKKYGEPPNLNDPGYNYRAAWKAGLRPQDVKDDPEMQHWSSVTPSGESLKSRSHPTAWKEDYMQMTGRDPGEPGKLTPEQIEGMKKALMYRYSEKYQQGGNVDGFKITKTYPVAPETKKQKRSKAEAAFANWSDWQNMPRIPREAGAPGYKGLGYFGRLPSVDEKGKPTYSTELAGEMDGIHFPLLVPTLSKDEVSQLLAGKPATDAIWKKAYEHALMRGRGAKSPFATQYDMPVERPR